MRNNIFTVLNMLFKESPELQSAFNDAMEKNRHNLFEDIRKTLCLGPVEQIFKLNKKYADRVAWMQNERSQKIILPAPIYIKRPYVRQFTGLRFPIGGSK